MKKSSLAKSIAIDLAKSADQTAYAILDNGEITHTGATENTIDIDKVISDTISSMSEERKPTSYRFYLGKTKRIIEAAKNMGLTHLHNEGNVAVFK